MCSAVSFFKLVVLVQYRLKADLLRDGKAEVQSADGGDDTNTDQSAPHLVNSNLTLSSASSVRSNVVELRLEANGQANHDDSTTKLAETLHGEHGAHHGTSPLGRSKLGCDDGRKRVVTTDTYHMLDQSSLWWNIATHQYPSAHARR